LLLNTLLAVAVAEVGVLNVLLDHQAEKLVLTVEKMGLQQMLHQILEMVAVAQVTLIPAVLVVRV
jgi:hypothetical protein